MFSFEEIYDDTMGIYSILDDCNDQLEYYTKTIDMEISTSNDLNKIKYYESCISNIKKSIDCIIRDNPGHNAIVALLCGINLSRYNFIKPSNSYSYSMLDNSIRYDSMGKLCMVYLRDEYYIKSVHNIVKDVVISLSISSDINKTMDDSFEYSINNLSLELEKLDLDKPIDAVKVKYISEIYVMIFDLIDYYINDFKKGETRND
nr:MAG TPA: hypothetical protein [Caudoviricetes sp.]